MTAQVGLQHRGEPPQAVRAGRALGQQEGGLGEVHLRGDGLHPGRVGLLGQQADGGRVAGERALGEGVNLVQGEAGQRGHGGGEGSGRRMATCAIPASSNSSPSGT